MDDKTLLERAVTAGLLSPTQRREVERWQERTGDRTTHAVLSCTNTPVSRVLAWLAREYNVPALDVRSVDVPQRLTRRIPGHVAMRYAALPIAEDGDRLVVVMANPHDVTAREQLAHASQCQIEPRVGIDRDIAAAIERIYAGTGHLHPPRHAGVPRIVAEPTSAVRPIEATGDDRSVVQQVHRLLDDAVRRHASDIHIEPGATDLRIRYRMDGVLRVMSQPSRDMHAAMVSRLKVMAGMDIAERRLPQDGRIVRAVGDALVLYRVSTLPTVHGEKVVLRVLDTARTFLALDALGMDTSVHSSLTDALAATAGIVLVTGPTGSGKTSTLYAMLAHLNRHDVNVVTIEEPVEYTLPGVQQVDVRSDIGVSFSSALRAFLRQDPDIMMVGEIRDGDTAAMAVRAALTGHLVLSTLHTNSAAETVTRLVDMGVAPYQLAASVHAVIAQRLVRKVCTHCPTMTPADVRDILALDADPDAPVQSLGLAPSALPGDVSPDTPLRALRLTRGAGCASCGGTGYAGRAALFEFLPMVPALRTLVQRNASHDALRAAADRLGFLTLRADGWRQTLLGVTTLGQVARVTRR